MYARYFPRTMNSGACRQKPVPDVLQTLIVSGKHSLCHLCRKKFISAKKLFLRAVSLTHICSESVWDVGAPFVTEVYYLCILINSIPYCLAVTPCSLLRPPPIFGRNYCLGYSTLHYTPPLQAARAGLRYCSSCTCTRVASVEELYLCITRIENSLRTGLGLFR